MKILKQKAYINKQKTKYSRESRTSQLVCPTHEGQFDFKKLLPYSHSFAHICKYTVTLNIKLTSQQLLEGS